MAAIQNNEQFYSELEQAMSETQALMGARPDKQRVLEDIELQLDILRRRTAAGQTPTTDEKRVISIAGLAHEHFAPGPGPNGVNRERPMLAYKSRLSELHYYYVNWPGTEPLEQLI